MKRPRMVHDGDEVDEKLVDLRRPEVFASIIPEVGHAQCKQGVRVLVLQHGDGSRVRRTAVAVGVNRVLLDEPHGLQRRVLVSGNGMLVGRRAEKFEPDELHSVNYLPGYRVNVDDPNHHSECFVAPRGGVMEPGKVSAFDEGHDVAILPHADCWHIFLKK